MAAVGDAPPSEEHEDIFDVDYLAHFAVGDHNSKQNALLKLEKILKVREQIVAGKMYYLTLQVSDGGEKKMYEAKVWIKPWEKFKEVQWFRPVDAAPST